MQNLNLEYPSDWNEYELIDSGNGEKLERYGDYTIVRPDPRIIWGKIAPDLVWNKANAKYIRTDSNTGNWNIINPPPQNWQIKWKDITFKLKPSEFKHTGVFPEQAINWTWLIKTINNQPLKILNLFAYTGGASMASLIAGANVTHLDSAKSTLDWAHENIIASRLDTKPIRWIEDDAFKFVSRELKRGNTYDGIIMDPPRFGRGTKGEVWKLEKDLPDFLKTCLQLLSPNPKFLLINTYTADLSSTALFNAVSTLMKDKLGTIEAGELALQETFGKRLVPNGIFCRWSKI
jgi:23S rRNA (cytosine1962-C5)-methyltransferase